MRTAIRTLLTASIFCAFTAIAPAQEPDPLPPLDGGMEMFGKFDIRYRPVMCIRAPCPPGNYVITLSNGLVGVFRTIVLVHELDGRQETVRYEGQYLRDIGGVEGRFFREGNTARIVVRRTVEGRWKP